MNSSGFKDFQTRTLVYNRNENRGLQTSETPSEETGTSGILVCAEPLPHHMSPQVINERQTRLLSDRIVCHTLTKKLKKKIKLKNQSSQ